MNENEEAAAEAIALLEGLKERLVAVGEAAEERSRPIIARLNKCAEMLGIEERYTHSGMFVQLQQFVPIIEALTRRVAN